VLRSSPLLLLASNSPRRRQLLQLGGWTFSPGSIPVDETPQPGEHPAEYVLRLAESKARAAAAGDNPGLIVVAADTAVVDEGQILGKPADTDEAISLLVRLRGHTHQVFTGLAALQRSDGLLLTDLCITAVPMRDYSDEEIAAYARSGDPLDKAGAYAIQHPEFRPVEAFGGCYASVMGLPLCHLARTLRNLDAAPPADVAANCQAALDYLCPVSQIILNGGQAG
jgi:septum formation protein